MAQQKTWDANRTGGGTYEFSRDAQGNYVLNSVGFQKFGKLNLPDLGKATTQTTKTTKDTTKDTAALSTQTKQAFGDVKPFYYGEEGGKADQYTMKKEGDLSTDTKPMVSSDRQPGFEVSDTIKRPLNTVQFGEPVSYLKKREDWYTDIDSPMGPDLKKTEEAKKLPADYTGASTYYKGIDEAPLGKGVRQEKDVLAQKTVDKYPEMVGPQKPSPYQDAIMRGERGVKYEKPGIPQVKKQTTSTVSGGWTKDPSSPTGWRKTSDMPTTALKAVNTASKVLAKAVGYVMNVPILGSVIGSMKDTPTDKHARGYFNMDPAEQGGRISGNPATDLYAGMNAVSMFGNIEKAGASRIDRREKTIEKKGYKAGDKFYDDTQKMKDDQKGYRSSKNEAAVKEAVSTGASIHNPAEMRAATGGGSGGGNTRVICTELHSTGEMSTRDWIRDIRFTYKDLSKEHIKGYLLWAVPTVEHIKKYPTYRKFWKHIAQHRANDIAWRLNQGKFDLLGRIYAGIGEPLCWLIGKCVSNKQIKELELNNWRKA